MKAPRAWALAGGSPSVVLGRSQHLLPTRSVLPVRRRASGGGAVLTGPWLLRAAVRLPRDHPLLRHGPAALAQRMGGVHLHWLQAHGVAGASLHAGPGAGHWACFGACSTGEVTIGGCKLTGIAQAWRRTTVLVAAGTLVHLPPWSMLCEALGRPASQAAELVGRTATLEQCVQRPVNAVRWASDLHGALVTALHRAAAAPRRARDDAPASSTALAPDQLAERPAA